MLAVLVPLGALSVLFLAFVDNQPYHDGFLGAAASAQSFDNIAPAPVQIGTAIYVNLEGIDGESNDIDYRDWISLSSLRQGQYIPASAIGSDSGGASSVFEEIALKKELDKASPKIAAAVSMGKVFPKVDVHITRAMSDGTRVTYYAYELTNVALTSYRARVSTKDDIPVEDISMSFEQIKVTYTKFDDTGRSESISEYNWDVVRNRPR